MIRTTGLTLLRAVAAIAETPGVSATWEPLHSPGVYYRPPGVWCHYSGDRTAADCPAIFWFPDPYHPTEVWAARSSFGGRGDDPKLLVALQRQRYAGWARYTEALAKPLRLSPATVRLVYHVFTPLSVNAAPDGPTDAIVRDARTYLYDLMGVPDPETWAGEAERTADGRGVPVRMRFWGGEVTGDIEL